MKVVAVAVMAAAAATATDTHLNDGIFSVTESPMSRATSSRNLGLFWQLSGVWSSLRSSMYLLWIWQNRASHSLASLSNSGKHAHMNTHNANISLTQQQFVVTTHTIRQSGIPASLDSHVTNTFHSFHWHVQNAMIPCLSQDLLPFLSVMYFFLPPFSTNYSSILSHIILPSISWSTSQYCCSQIHI